VLGLFALTPPLVLRERPATGAPWWPPSPERRWSGYLPGLAAVPPGACAVSQRWSRYYGGIYLVKSPGDGMCFASCFWGINPGVSVVVVL
jgi:hypothetical protein